jgi:hypothetical protein
MFSSPTFLFLTIQSFYFFNFNFSLKGNFFNILVLEFKKEERKSSKNNKEKRKLMNCHFSVMKLNVLGVNEFYSTSEVQLLYFFNKKNMHQKVNQIRDSE